MNPGQCKDGLLVPAMATSVRAALFYLAALLYCFLGTAIIADIFMCAIERITSTTRKIRKQRPDGTALAEVGEGQRMLPEHEEYDYVRIWNPTVANLTLMALGSSAPEILLSLIEIVGNDFKAGDLGPGTIVGSAAFNLFCISAICVLAVGPRAKRIAQWNVFLVTAAFSVFAYLWIMIILVWITPNVIDIWEAALTFSFFFVLVIIAYAFDVQLWNRKTKKPDAHILSIAVDDQKEVAIGEDGQPLTVLPSDDLPVPDLATVRGMTREVARVYPSLTSEDHAKILAYRINQNTMPHDRLYYRIKAIRQMTSSWKESKTEQEVKEFLRKQSTFSPEGRLKPRIEFSARTFGVQPGDKVVILTIVRRGQLVYPITISYHTVNGIAKKDLHFMEKKASIRFEANERVKNIKINLVEDADWSKVDSVFYVHLKIQEQEDEDRTKLGDCNVARIRPVTLSTGITGHPSVEFSKQNYLVSENAGWVRAYVTLKGRLPIDKKVGVTYATEDVSAQADLDYVPVRDGLLEFTGNEIEKAIDIEIIDDKADEKDETFLLTISKVDDVEVTSSAHRRTTITIISDDNALKNVTNVRKLMGNYLRGMKIERASWRDQIINATSVNAGDVANATVADAIKHGLAFPWKFVFAFVPPAELFGGWPCFIIALFLIGVVTAIVGDVASIFGCMVNMPDAVTAITLVALGTSLPDTFASKIAAESDPTADNAVGNVTGSNSVNVFLGLGLPWLVASIYWACKGETFKVDAGDLSYSVAIFTVLSMLCLSVLVLRRWAPAFGQGELGGPRANKIATAVFFVLLWVVYLFFSIWRTVNKQE